MVSGPVALVGSTWQAFESSLRRNREQATIVGANDLPAAFMNHPVMPVTEGLLPNSRQQTTIGVPSFLTCVSAGGAALDGVQSGRAEALPQLLARRSRPRKAHRSTPGRGCRFRIRTQLGQQALQPHRPTIGRPGGPVQALAARLPLQHS